LIERLLTPEFSRLAGGGYHNADAMEQALVNLQSMITKGRGITINLIYANPQAIAWQIPLIKKLCARGMPIDGLTFGAGVPSTDVARELFEMGLKHISFKPGSTNAIKAVLEIAKEHPRFPIILQWTGGRAGGHHSCEDFHQPIINMYAKIRRHPNIILVAGSGFGGWEDTYPYLTGKWSTSTQYEHPPMPFDGCLFGSRVMVAKEAHTSLATQKAISETPGLNDSKWEKTSEGPSGAGGIITVISEMGEPIHMLATRGAKLWAEMDRIVFNLPNDKRLAVLKSKRSYIIERLNTDFQKVWFGRNKTGQAVDLDEMTYAEVMHRIVELLFIHREEISQWIDKSHAIFVTDWVRRVEERFVRKVTQPITSHRSIIDDPVGSVSALLKAYPQAHQRIVIAEDVQYFLHLCQRRNQKPVSFIPALDDNFQIYFKKDSLWQSEDLDAVVGQDVGRVCILQGPVAAKHSTVIGEPVGQILDSINRGHIESLCRDLYDNDDTAITTIQCSDRKQLQDGATSSHIDGVLVHETDDSIYYHVSCPTEAEVPSPESWFQLLSGSQHCWRHALFTSERFMAGTWFQPNCIKAILAPVLGLTVEIQYPNEPLKTQITVKEPPCSNEGQHLTTMKVELYSETEILVRLFHHDTADRRSVGLPLRFSYYREIGSTPIHEILHDRNLRIKNFYWRVWFGDSTEFPEFSVATNDINVYRQQSTSEEYTITHSSIQDFVRSIENGNESFLGRGGKSLLAPMDYSIIAGWKATMKPLFAIEGDLLRLVHLSNQFKMMPGSSPLKEGDRVTSTARISAVLIQDSGKVVEVISTISSLGKTIVEITSRFLYRGEYNDFESTFQDRQEIPMKLHLATTKDVAVFKSKRWFEFHDPDNNIELLGQNLIFRLHSTYRFKDTSKFSGLETTGKVFVKYGTMELAIGKVQFTAGPCTGNPVTDYLQRYGTPMEQAVPLQNPIHIQASTEHLYRFTTPSSNKAYSYASGDFNPIHTSRVFSRYSNLPETITHGMFVSASVRKVLDDNFVGVVYRFATSFVGMVLPGDEITVALQHTAMIQGRKLFKIETRKACTDELVLTGEAEVEQAPSSYIFTGQGSQTKGMGMDLYETSATARDVWDRADKYFKTNYGKLTHP
jgi:fatty acid synthase subunit beta